MTNRPSTVKISFRVKVIGGFRQVLEIFAKEDGKFIRTENIELGSWINMHDPTGAEIDLVSSVLGVERDIITTVLDEEERAHIEDYGDVKLIVVDIPEACPPEDVSPYNTFPLGIILAKDKLLTVSLKALPVLKPFLEGKVKNFSINKRMRFILQILLYNSSLYLQNLRSLNKMSGEIEKQMRISMRNHELFEMLRIEKSLVYFSTSLKANDIVLEKLLKMDILQKYTEDDELLEDVLIENKQAIEMCSIYREVMGVIMDTFASMISNNLNIVMKVLTSVTLVMSVITMISGLWGMNVPVPFQEHPYGFLIMGLGSLVLSIISAFFLWKKKMF